MGIILCLAWAASVLYAVVDAGPRGNSALLWGLLTFGFGPFGLIAYLLARNPLPTPSARPDGYMSEAEMKAYDNWPPRDLPG